MLARADHNAGVSDDILRIMVRAAVVLLHFYFVLIILCEQQVALFFFEFAVYLIILI